MRCAEGDFADCLALLDKAAKESLPLDARRVLGELEGLPAPEDKGVRGRRDRLRAHLKGPRPRD